MTDGQSYVKRTVSAAIKKKTSSPRASGPHYGTERSSQGGRVLKAGRGRGPIYGSGQMDTLAQKKGGFKKKKKKFQSAETNPELLPVSRIKVET